MKKPQIDRFIPADRLTDSPLVGGIDLGEFIARLLASGDVADAELALRLERLGWAGLSQAEALTLLERFSQSGFLVQAAPTTTDAPRDGQGPDAGQRANSQAAEGQAGQQPSGTPAPQDGGGQGQQAAPDGSVQGQPAAGQQLPADTGAAGSAGQRLFQAIVKGEVPAANIVPQAAVSQQVTDAPPSQPIGNSILSALSRGDVPIVSTTAQPQSTEAGRFSTSPAPTPPVAPGSVSSGQAGASASGAPSPTGGMTIASGSSGLSSNASGSISPSSSVTSSMSRVDNLGISVDQANAGILTAFVEQRIGQAGSLASRVEITGATTLQNTGVVSTGTTGRQGSAAIDVPAAPPPKIDEEKKVEPPAPPPVLNGAVRIELAAGQAASVAEGGAGSEDPDQGVTYLVFTVTRSNGRVGDRIPYAVTGIDPDDLAEGSLDGQAVEFAAGETVREIRIAIRRDRHIEPDEPVTVTLYEGEFSELIPGQSVAQVLVLNDDRFVSIARAPEQDASVTEGNGGADPGTVTVVFRVTRTDSSEAESIPYAITGIDSGDLAEGSLTGNQVSFAAGELVKEIRVILRRDDQVESDEYVEVTLKPTPRTGVVPGSGSDRVEVPNDDFFVSIARAPAQPDAVTEGSPVDDEDESVTEVVFVVSRTHADMADAFAYTIGGVDENDLVQDTLSGNLIEFDEGEFEKEIRVRVRKDKQIENDEPLTVTITGSDRARVLEGEGSASVDILNDEGYLLSGLRAALIEGNDPDDGNDDPKYTTVLVRLTRSAPSGADGTALLEDPNVPWRLEFGDAAAPGNLLASEIHPEDLDGVASFAEGQATTFVPIRVLADNVLEDDEIFTFAVEPTRRLIVDPADSIKVIVANDDPTIEIIADSLVQEVYEGNPLNFEVRRTSGLTYDQPITLNYELVPMTRGETSLPPSGNRTGTITFQPGDAIETLTINTVNDQFFNSDQRFYLLLSSTNPDVRISGTAAEGIVLSDDSLVSVASITNAANLDANGLRTYTVSITREGPAQFARSLTWSIAGIGENPAKPNDFVFASGESFKVDFPAGATTATVQFKAKPGLISDGERGFEVRLSDTNQDHLELGVDAIRANIIPVGVSAALVPVATGLVEGSDDGNSATVDARTHQFEIRLTGPAPVAVQFNWTLTPYESNGVNAADFGGVLPSGTVSIAQGGISGQISLTPSVDAAVEPNERFYLNLAVAAQSAMFAGVAVPRLIGTISNDDASIGFASAGQLLAADEGAPGGSGTWRIPVIRDGFSRSEVSVEWRVVLVTDGSADSRAAASDFSGGMLPSGRLTLLPGEMKADIELTLAGDSALEQNERFQIVLVDGSVLGGALLGANRSATGQINNDDTYLRIGSIAPVVEGQGGLAANNEFIVTFVRDGDLRQPARANYAIEATKNASGNADAADLIGGLAKGSVNFAAGQGEAVLRIAIAADTVEEANETFSVRLTGTPTARHLLSAVPEDLVQEARINNDDDTVSFSSVAGNLAQSISEDAAITHGVRTITYTLVRSGDTSKASSIYWSVDFTGQTATADDFLDADGDPYSPGDSVGGVVSFAAGASSAQLHLRARNDNLVEGNETFRVVLSDTDQDDNSVDPLALGTRVAASNGSTTGTLVNDDVAIVATLAGGPLEGDAGNTNYTYTLSRVGDTTQASAITWYFGGADIVENGVLKASALNHGDGTTASTAEYSGPAGSTYGAASLSADLSWASGDSLSVTKTIVISVSNDNLTEGPEGFALTLANQAGAHAAQFDYTDGINLDHASSGSDRGLKGQILDNDARVWIEAATAVVVEGAGGSQRTVTFHVYREGDLGSAFTVPLVVGGNASGLSGGVASVSFDADTPVIYDSTSPLTDPPRQRVSVSYTLAGDNTVETGEKIDLNLGALVSSPTPAGRNVTVDPATATTAVINDDFRITAATSPASFVNEGTPNANPAAPAGSVTYTFTRVPIVPNDLPALSLPWRAIGASTAGGAPVPPVDAADFSGNALPYGTLNFAANAATATVTLTFNADSDIEPSEFVGILLDTSVGNIEADFKTFEVRADDAGFNVVARRLTIVEGDDPSAGSERYVEFDVVGIGQTATRSWELTAKVGNDPALLSSVLAAGEVTTGSVTLSNSTETIRFKLLQDSSVDEDVALTLSLSNGSTLVASDSTTVLEDDAELAIAASSGTTVAESSDATPGTHADSYTKLEFTVSRSGNLGQVTTVPWSLAFANGLNEDDFFASGWTINDNGTTLLSSTYELVFGNGAQSPATGMTGTLTFADTRAEAVRSDENVLDIDLDTDQIIRLFVRTDWLKEADEAVTVILGSPSAGSSIASGSQSATTTITNDDAEVQFTPGSLSLSLSEGDNGTSDFTFTLERSGNTAIASDVTWFVRPSVDANGNDVSGGLTTTDFEGNTTDDAGWAAGTVSWAANDTATKTVTVKVNADTFERYSVPFYGYPLTQSTKLEIDEYFTVGLANGKTTFVSPGADTVVPSVGTSIGNRDEAQGTIGNDDVKIQITQIRSNLAEGTQPAANGDVDQGAVGVQKAIQHTITFVRQGDDSRPVWFDWAITEGGFTSQVFHSELIDGPAPSSAPSSLSLANPSVSTTGTISWAAGESGPKTLVFSPIGDDTIENDYAFGLRVTDASDSTDLVGSAQAGHIDEFSFQTGTGSIHNHFPQAGEIELVKFVIKRDEAGVWVSSDLVTGYDPQSSSPADPEQQYSASDPFNTNSYYPGDWSYLDYSGEDEANVEGSLGVAVGAASLASGTDYQTKTETLNFTEADRVKPFTVSIRDDQTFETREGVGVYLYSPNGLTIADEQGRLTIVDDDGAQGYWLTVNGSTAIEGLDDYARFTIDLGKELTTRNSFDIEIGGTGSRALAFDDGEPGDWGQYFDYSTDGGQTWMSNAPVFEYAYRQGSVASSDDQVVAAYRFQNGSEYGNADTWLEFGDLRAAMGYQVGGTITQVAEDGSFEIWIPVRADTLIDPDALSLKFAGGRQTVGSVQYAGLAQGSTANALNMSLIGEMAERGIVDPLEIRVIVGTNGLALVDSNGNGVIDSGETTVAFDMGSTGPASEDKLGLANGPVVIEFEGLPRMALDLGGFGADDRIEIDRTVFGAGGFEIRSDLGETARQTSKSGNGFFGFYPSNMNNFGETVPFVVMAGNVPQVGPALRLAAAHSATNEFVFTLGAFGQNNSSYPSSLNQYVSFVNGVSASPNSAGDLLGEIQDYFLDLGGVDSDPTGVKFLQFTGQLTGEGGRPIWHLEGLDAANVVAPQDGSWSELIVVRELTVTSGAGLTDASIALDTRALHDNDGNLSAAGTFQPAPLRPAFTIISDSIDTTGIRTVEATISRAPNLGADAVHYSLNVDVADRAFQAGSAAREGIVSFDEGQTEVSLTFTFRAIPLPPPVLPAVYEQLVIVDRDPDGEVGAYIDQDGDGRISGLERTDLNQAFAEGQDLINLRENRVTIRFDALPDTPLNFQGFSADDRIEINLSQLGRDGWYQGNTDRIELAAPARDNNWLGEASASIEFGGRTAGGEDFTNSLRSDVAERQLRWSGLRRTTGSGDPLPWGPDDAPVADYDDRPLADFGVNHQLDGTGRLLSNFVSLVRNDPVFVIVGADGAYLDLDRDGQLDGSEHGAENRVFHRVSAGTAVGQDLLAHESVTIRYDAVPESPLVLDHLNNDDLILIGTAAAAEWVATRAAADAARLAAQPVDEWGVFAQRANGFSLPRGHSVESLVSLMSDLSGVDSIQVVVDTVLDAAGGRLTGAYRDINGDGRIGALEAVPTNLAFAADGTDLIGLDDRSVVIIFRDAPQAELDFSGFGVDDRVFVDLDGLGDNGWLGGGLAHYSEIRLGIGESAQTQNNEYSSGDVFAQTGRTAQGQAASLRFVQVVPAGSDSPLRLDIEGVRLDGEIDRLALAEFGQGRDALGLFGLEGRVEFVQTTPEVQIVVDGGQAYLDLDADGVLDNAEARDDNLAFDHEGKDLIGLDRVNAVITFRDAPVAPLDFSGFGPDDRLEFDRAALAASGWGGADVEIAQTISDARNSLSVTGHDGRSGFWYAGNGLTALMAGAWQSTTDSAVYTIARFGENYLFDVSARPALQASLVRGEVARVIIDENGGWLDLDQDGVLSADERAEDHQVFDFDPAAGASNRVGLDLAATKAVLVFQAVPHQPADLSGFGRDDRVVIDQSAFFARGWDLALGSPDAIRSTEQIGNASGAILAGDQGTLAVAQVAISGQDVLALGTNRPGVEPQVGWLAQFGSEPVLARGSGDLAARVDFVRPDFYIVVTESGAFFDFDANGILSDAEFAWAIEEGHTPFDPSGRDSRGLLENATVVVEFDNAPATPIDLSGFGDDDRIRIDARSFYAAGWADGLQATASTGFSFATQMQGSALIEQYASGEASRRAFGVGARFSRVGSGESDSFSPAMADNMMFVRSSVLGEAMAENTVALADFGDNTIVYEQYFALVDFVRSDLITGFLPGVDPIALGQRGSLTGERSDPDVLELGAGASRVEIRAPLRDDDIDELLESITLSVSDRTDGQDYLVPAAQGSTSLVDDDAPILTQGEHSLYDGILRNHYALVVFDVNNRDGDTPHVGNSHAPTDSNAPPANEIYRSDSLQDNVAAGQAFTVKLRFLGNWEVALVGAQLPALGQGYTQTGVLTLSDSTHNDGPPFRAIENPATETLNGKIYNVFDLLVPAGTRQILMRSLVGDYSNLSEQEAAIQESVNAVISRVDPLVVVRDRWIDEDAGTATLEAVAVGGTIGPGGASVTLATQDGLWDERQFIVSREYASFGSLTLGWAVEALGNNQDQGILIDGNGAGDYVNGYFGQIRTGTVDADDFVLVPGQVAGTGPLSAGLPTGTVSFADGQKEALITVRVRADNRGEMDEDFRITLSQPPAGVELLPNPQGPLTFKAFGSAGYGKIINDDQVFTLTGLLLREDIASRVEGSGNNRDQSEGPGYAIPGQPQGLNAPAGYTLHQFIIQREGDNLAAATVDWVLQLKGSDPAGYEKVGNVAQAHRAETADFYAHESGNYNDSHGFTWGAAVGGIISSAPKTVSFAPGQSQAVVTFAVADDAWSEDAEVFSVQLLNPVALPGNDGNPGVSQTRGNANFLIADDDGSRVSVRIDWLDNSGDSTANALQSSLGNQLTGAAVFEGSSADWMTATAADYSNGDLLNDRRMLLTFTRSSQDLSEASEAFFEVSVKQSGYGGPDAAALQTGLIPDQGDLWSGYDYRESVLWRGTVSFAAGSAQTTAPVTIRIPDDNLVDGDQQFTVTLYDHEHLPEVWFNPYNNSGNLGDTIGIGSLSKLPDWNTTLRDAVLYTATATVVDDDVRLWFNGFRGPLWPSNNNYETIPSVGVDEGTFAYPYPTGSDPAAPYGEAESGTAGDLVLNFARAGLQQGDITLSWKILDSSGTVDYSDFDPSYWRDTNGGATSILANVAQVGGTFVLSGTAAGAEAELERTITHTLRGLFRPDREIEDDESFQIEFAVASVASGPLSLSSVLFTPNYANEASQIDNGQHNASQLAGTKNLLVNGVVHSDDVKYGIDLASTEADHFVTEGDSGTPITLSFDVTRAISPGQDTAGFNGGSSVGWRIVPVPGQPAPDASDFIDGLTGRVEFSGQAWIGGSYVQPNEGTDIKRTLSLRIRPDTKVEYGEHFLIELYDPSVGYVDPLAKSAQGVILNDDTGLILNDFRVIEGDSGEDALAVTLLRVGAMGEDSDFKWTLFNADTSNVDFGDGLTAGDLTLSASDGTTGTPVDGFAVQYYTYTLSAEIAGDTVVETDESFRIRLTKLAGIDELLLGSSTDAALGNATGDTAGVPDSIDHTLAALEARSYVLSADTGAGQAAVTLLNDDTIFSAQAVRTEQLENGGTGYTFVITRSVATPQPQTVTWSVLAAGGRNVVDAADFGGTLPSGDVTFSGAELSKTITVAAPSADGAPEADEVFTLEVTAFKTGAEGDAFVTTGAGALGVIRNDDASVYISDSKPIIQTEGSGAQTRNYTFDIVRSGSGSASPSTVAWELVFGSPYGAVAADFTGTTSGTASFAGDGVVSVSIAIAPDTDVETLQDFGIRLKNAVGSVQIVGVDANGAGPIARAQIGDDDFTLALEALQPDGSMEGDGRSGASFVLKRAGALDLPVTLNWMLTFPQTGAAASASDFVASSGTLVMPGGLQDFQFSLPLQGEVDWEEDEGYTLQLVYQASSGEEVALSADSKILNDDEGFSVVLAGDALDTRGVLEGSASVAGSMTLRFIREGDLSGESAVDWALTASNAATRVTTSGSASDFGPVALSGRVSFDGTETSYTGENGQQYAYRDIVIPLVGDNKYEADEGFVVTLSNQSAGSSIRQATLSGLIYNDDIGYRISLAAGTPDSLLEGNEGETVSTGGHPPGSVVFVLTREADPVTIGRSSRLGWTLSSTGGDATALQAADVEVSGSGVSASGGLTGTVSFEPGETRKEVLVTMVGDDIREATARMTMTIARTSADTASTILAPSASVQVNDDDDTLAVAALPGAPLSEGNPAAGGEPGIYQFTVSRTGNPVGVASVDWSLLQTGSNPVSMDDLDSILVDGALLPSTLGGTLTFADGVISDKLIEVRVKPDRVGEEDERLTIGLSAPSAGSRITTASSTQVVFNDDPLLRLLPDGTEALEGNEGADGGFTFRLVRGGDSTGEVAVEWAVVPAGDAPVDLADFGGVFPSGLVTFQAGGSDEQFVRVLFQGDEVGEADEGFRIELRTVTGADIVGPDSVDMSLLNDDLAIRVEAPQAAEGDDGQPTSMGYRLSVRGPAIADRVTVKWHVEGFGIHPASVDDFVAGQDLQGGPSLELFNGLPSGVSTIRLVNGLGLLTPTIVVAGDDTYGVNESFRLVIDSIDAFTRDDQPIGASVVNADLVATTRDDDLLIGLADGRYAIVEGDQGEAVIKFWIDVLGESDLSPELGDVLVDWSVTGDLSEEDLVATSGQGVPLAFDEGTDRWYVSVAVRGDELIEPNERFSFRLDDAYDPTTGGGVEVAEKGNTAAATILGDDFGIQLTNPSINQTEDRARFEYEILRDGPLDQTMAVRLRVGVPADGGDGVSANDFLPHQGLVVVDVKDDPETTDIDESGTYLEAVVSLAANQTSARFSIEAEHDPFPEADERFVVDVTVIAISGEAVASPTWQERDQITATIVNDDQGSVQTVNPDPVLDPIQLPPT